jgi:hypothetical protein
LVISSRVCPIETMPRIETAHRMLRKLFTVRNLSEINDPAMMSINRRMSAMFALANVTGCR